MDLHEKAGPPSKGSLAEKMQVQQAAAPVEESYLSTANLLTAHFAAISNDLLIARQAAVELSESHAKNRPHGHH